MILTITLNPSVDIGYALDSLKMDDVNRVDNVSKTAGGKGLNVARVLKQLNTKVAATGFLGGELGAFISSQLKAGEIEDYFSEVEDDTRNCIAIMHEGKQTEILEAGPTISAKEAEQFVTNFTRHIKTVDYITMSGSLPKGLAKDFYVSLIEIANENETPVLLDTSGESLAHALESAHKPYLIKPNLDELSGLVNKELATEAEIINVLEESLFTGIEWVVVTLGSDGALIKRGEVFYRLSIPTINAINPVGSGDSVIAGFAAGFEKGLSAEEVMKYGMTMGILNAMEAKTGSVNVDQIPDMMAKITVKAL